MAPPFSPAPSCEPEFEELTSSDRWKEADFGEVPFQTDGNQVTIFYDDSDEPPDPDDYLNLDDYHQAWADWEIQVLAQVTASTVVDTVKSPVRAQVKLDTKKVAPEHTTHWVEKYWVERSGNKYWYYRYCWMVGRKKNRRHIGSVDSGISKRKKADVEIAIADGKLPSEIEQLIRGFLNESPTMPKMPPNNTNL